MTRRRWFQLHLSTLVVLTLAAGFVIRCNFKYRFSGVDAENVALVRGWPVPAIKYIELPRDSRESINWAGDDNFHLGRQLRHTDIMDSDPNTWTFESSTPPEWSLAGIAANVFTLIAFLTVLGVLMEHLIRRRKPPA